MLKPPFLSSPTLFLTLSVAVCVLLLLPLPHFDHDLIIHFTTSIVQTTTRNDQEREPDEDAIADFLFTTFEKKLKIVIEDGSCEEISRTFITLYEECGSGHFSHPLSLIQAAANLVSQPAGSKVLSDPSHLSSFVE